jgi:hypothetical protein
VNDVLTSQLTEVGLTRNEAIAYVCLLEADDASGLTGYEVAARSGVPRSAVYGVLRKLETAGAAFANGEKPARYVAVSPSQLVEGMRARTRIKMDRLDDSLARVSVRERPEPVWILSRYDEVMERLETMVRGASQSIAISGWRREMESIAPTLRRLDLSSVHFVAHVPDGWPTAPKGIAVWSDPHFLDDGHKADWSHKLLAVTDRREALIGGAEPNHDNHAVWTTNPALVDVATDHIVLDVTLLARAQGRDCADDVSPIMRPHLSWKSE